MENDDVSVHFSVTGTPDPNITWFRTGKNGSSSKQIAACPSKLSDCKISSLRYKDVTKNMFRVWKMAYPDDDGIRYTCLAKNSVGETFKYFTIKVYSKCVH